MGNAVSLYTAGSEDRVVRPCIKTIVKTIKRVTERRITGKGSIIMLQYDERMSCKNI